MTLPFYGPPFTRCVSKVLSGSVAQVGTVYESFDRKRLWTSLLQ